MKNIIANSIMYTGAFIATLGQKFVKIGINLHIKFNTESGQKFKKLEVLTETFKNMFKDIEQTKRNDNAAIFLKNKT